MAKAEIPTISVAVIGQASIGKTALITRMVKDVYSKSDPTTGGGDFSNLVFTYAGGEYKIQLTDTAGEEKFSSLTKIYVRDKNILLLCVSLFDSPIKSNHRETLQFYYDFVKEANDSASFIVVRTKVDREPLSEVEEIKEFAKSINAEFVETSSATGEGIEALKNMIVKTAIDNNHIQKASPSTLKPVSSITQMKSKCCE